jgi:hypothetical protein
MTAATAWGGAVLATALAIGGTNDRATAQVAPAQIVLAWPSVGGATGYTVGRKAPVDSFFSTVATLDAAAVGYGDSPSTGYGDADGAGEVVWYSHDVTVLAEGTTRPFYAPLDIGPVVAPLDVAAVTAPLDLASVRAPLDVASVIAPLDMETEVT